MADLTTGQFDAARSRGDTLLQGPRAESVHYDAGRDRVIVRLTTGVEIGFAPHDAQGLQRASLEDLLTIELDPFGLGIHFPRLDADVYVPALLQGLLGSESWMQSRSDTLGAPVRGSAEIAVSHAKRKLGSLAGRKLSRIETSNLPGVSCIARGRKLRRSSIPVMPKRQRKPIR